MGTPVVTDALGGSWDWSEAGVIRVPVGHSKQWSEAIDRLLSDSTVRQRLGQAGRRAVSARFSRSHFVDHWQRMLGGPESL